jgi:PKD-like domain/Secretion system C-terminal sorting domain
MKQTQLFVFTLFLLYNTHLNAQCSGQYSPAGYAVSFNGVNLSVYDSTPVVNTTYIVEYGLAGFTPGTGATAGVGGTVNSYTNATPFGTGFFNLIQATVYDYYIRKSCNGSYSVNSPKYSVYTFYDCSTTPTITCGQVVQPNYTAGVGAWRKNCGGAGKERLYYFTPAISGTYTLTLSGSPNPVSFYSIATTNCSSSWNCIGKNATSTLQYQMQLSGGATYTFMADPDFITGGTAGTFSITCPCAAPTNVQASNYTQTSAIITYSGSATILEYGPTGFTPGTGASPGVNGTIRNAYNGVQLTGLTPGTTYKLYARNNCSGVYSLNTSPIYFNTLSCPIITTYTSGSLTINQNNFYGVSLYPNQFQGCGGSGEQKIIRYTPTTSGFFEMSIMNDFWPNPQTLTLGYRVASAVCDLTGYQCLYPYYTYYNNPNPQSTDYYRIGTLTAGTTYEFIMTPYDSLMQGQSTINIYCGNATEITTSNIQSTSVKVNYYCSCPNSIYLEYGLSGFTPGTGSAAGGGTLVQPGGTPYIITGLLPYTKYDAYFRSSCSGTFTANTKFTFTTLPNCSTAPQVACGDTIIYKHFLSDKSGVWSNYGCATGMDSKEDMYRFTTTTAGYYSLYNYGGAYYTGNTITAYYKPTAGVCDASSWTCIGNVNQHPQTFTFGPLTANTSYNLLFDGYSSAGNTWKYMKLQCAVACTASFTPSGDIRLCQGSSVTLKANTGAGITYQWYQNGLLLSGATKDSLVVTNLGWYSVVENTPCGLVTSNNCYVSVFSSLSAGISNSTSTTFCSPGYSQLNISGPYYGATYQWQLNNVNIPGATQSTYQATAAGAYKVNVAVNGCASTTSNTITTTAATSVSAFINAATNTNLCPGSSVTYAIYTPVPGYSYQWKNNNINIPGATGTSYTTSTAGAYTCVVTANCGTATSSIFTVNNITQHTATVTPAGPITICNGTVQLTAAALPSGNYTYQWRKNGLQVAASGSSAFTATTSGNYTCQISNGCFDIMSNTVNVNIGGAIPTLTITGTTGFCRPSTNNIYTVTTVAGATYNWTVPTGATIVSGQGTNSINVSYASNAVAGTICVTATNACGSSPAVCFTTVLRSANPSTPGTITGSTNGCSGESKLYTIRKVATADYYIWTPPLGATINGSSSPFNTVDTAVTVTYTASFTGDSVRVQSGNCRGVSSKRVLRINHSAPSTPGAISGFINGLCLQNNKTYSIAAVTNAISYTWRTNIVGATINGSSSPVTTSLLSVSLNFASFVSGQIYVKANNGCGSSTERSLTVYARPDIPISITGPVSVCDSQPGVAYSTAAVANASSYNWTIPSGATFASGQGTTAINVNFGATPATGNVRVRAQNSCANSSYRTLSVTINNCPRLGEIDDDQIFISPNPFTNEATLYIPDALKTTSDIIIYNVLGKAVRRISGEQKTQILISKQELNSGIYILRFIADDGEHILRFMIQ